MSTSQGHDAAQPGLAKGKTSPGAASVAGTGRLSHAANGRETKIYVPDARVVDALTGRNAEGERAVALRTRRAVYHAVMDQRNERDQSRRNLLLALLLTGALTLALAPALWVGMDDLLGGETLLDLPGMLVALGMTLFAAVAAVLFLLGGERQAPRGARR